MRVFTRNNFRAHCIACGVVLAVWQGLTLLYSPLIIPTIPSVMMKFVSIVTAYDSVAAIGVTLARLAIGVLLGIVGGGVIGCLFGRFDRLYSVGKPILGLVQAVPPVSWLVLAFIWFGFDGRPSVFIVVVSILPIVAANMIEGIHAIDARLMDVARVYRFSPIKKVRTIVVPAILPYFRSALRIALGTGCKAVVMGEVLTTGNGIGGAITMGRMNMEPESVVAWSLVVLAIYYLLEFAAGRFVPEPGRRRC